MANYDITRAPHYLPASAGLFGTFVTLYTDWSERRATRAALMQLSDRELDDIGLTRGEVESSR